MHPYGLSAPHGGPQRTRALQTTQRRHSGRRLNLATTQYTTARDAESTANSGITAPERASYRNPAPDHAPTARRHEARSLTVARRVLELRDCRCVPIGAM